MNNLRMGHYRSAEKQTFWYASLRAKEAVYGKGAKEAACERLLLEQALDVARGQWRNVFRSPDREAILDNIDETNELLREIGLPTYDDQWNREHPEAAVRLESWLGADRPRASRDWSRSRAAAGTRSGGKALESRRSVRT